MDEKEAEIKVVDFEEEKRGQETGQFEESRRYCCSDQKTEARLDKGESTSFIKAKDESKRSTDQQKIMPIAIGSENKELGCESENQANQPSPSCSGFQKDEKEQHQRIRNEYPKKKGISKIQESVGKDGQSQNISSFIRPPNAPSFVQSLKYSTEVVAWIFYHSIILAIIPTIIIVIIYGSLWFFAINNGNMKIYFASTEAFYFVCDYAAVFGVFAYVFGRRRVMGLVYKLVIPLCLIAIGFSAFGTFLEISLIYVGTFLTFFSFVFLSMKNISTKTHPQARNEEIQNRSYVLASDGTPVAFMKGLVPAFIAYFLINTFIVPFCMDSGIFIRIVGRILVLPILFSISEVYMNNEIMHKSVEYLEYRMIPGNLMSVMFLAILRFMVSYSSNTYDTFIMALSSGVFEVILWSSHIPRSIYTMKIMKYIKSRINFSICGDNRVNNLNGVFPESSNPNERIEPRPNSEEIGQIQSLELSIAGFKRFFSQLNQDDSMSQYAIRSRTNRSLILCMSEIQFIVFIPVVLYLCNPIDKYIMFQPTSTITQFFASIFIQLPIELLTQISIICLENYLYGLQVPVEKSLEYSLKPLVVLQYTLISLFVMHQSTSNFWKTSEKWPEN